MQGSIGEKNNKTPKGCDFEGFDLIQPNKYGIVTGTPEITSSNSHACHFFRCRLHLLFALKVDTVRSWWVFFRYFLARMGTNQPIGNHEQVRSLFAQFTLRCVIANVRCKAYSKVWSKRPPSFLPELGTSIVSLCLNKINVRKGKVSVMQQMFTDEQVEEEINRLMESRHVMLAKQERKIRDRRRQYMYQLRSMEKRGKQLEKLGVTMDNMEEMLFGD